jgi:hypothetical protein
MSTSRMGDTIPNRCDYSGSTLHTTPEDIEMKISRIDKLNTPLRILNYDAR